jgi:hypothetical protein
LSLLIFSHLTGPSLTLFQKNKGTIVSDNATADYVILDSSREKDFASLLASTIAAGSVALRAAFVHDCIEEGALLDTATYAFSEPVPSKRKRASPGPHATASPKRQPVAKAKGKDKKEEETRKSQKNHLSTTDTDPTRRSPTPPATPTRSPSGRAQYTPEDLGYFLRYSRILLQRDVNASANSIARRMHRKVGPIMSVASCTIHRLLEFQMPWHPLSSWRTTISSARLADQLDIMRNELKASQSTDRTDPSVQPHGTPSKKARLEHESISNTHDQQEPGENYDSSPIKSVGSEMEQEDFRTICDFFAFAAPSSGDDNEVWASLATYVIVSFCAHVYA